jgi:predicted Zn-dependent peptidase
MTALDGRFTLRTLDNGLTVIVEHQPHVPSVAAGFLVRTGARDEDSEIQGVSHFLEHMMFKGTARRSAMDINQDFDRVGAQYNAYTSNEHTFYYGWVPAQSFGPLLDILADMMQSVLPPEEFKTEKQVILEEIAMYEDHLEMHTFDKLMEKAFAGHPLGGSVLGTNQTITDLRHEQMMAYFKARYSPENMLLAVCGNIDPDEALREAEHQTRQWTKGNAGRKQPPPVAAQGRHVFQKERFQRQTVCLVYPSVAAREVRMMDAAEMASDVLGRPDNSRLFWNITQKGMAETARAFAYDFTDTGLFVLYAAVEPDRAHEVLEALRAEAARFQSEGPAPDELARVRNTLKTEFALEAETPFNRLLQVARDMESLGRPRTPEERLEQFAAVTPDTVREYLNQYPIDGPGLLISAGPRDRVEA